MVHRVAGRLDADEREIFALDRIAVAQNRVWRVIGIMRRVDRIAGGPAGEIISAQPRILAPVAA